MKSIPLLILLGFLSLVARAQPGNFNTIADTSSMYLTPMEYAFMMHEEPKFMLRLPFLGLGAEFELLPHFTLMAQARFATEVRNVVETELRWYYSGKKRGMRNMSGNYLAVGMQLFDQGLFYVSEDGQVGWTNISGYFRTLGYVRWGMQRRMLGNGLIDLGLLAGYQPFISFQNGADYSAFRLSATAKLGLGLVFGNRKELDWQRLCPVTKCYEVERFMLKVNFANTLDYWYFPGHEQHSFWINPGFAFEHKILQSSFSVNANLRYNFGFLGREITDLEEQTYWHSLNLRLEGRWYYNMVRRMLRGKGGNGLSGNYIAAGATQVHFGTTAPEVLGSVDPYIVTGIQRTLGERFYIDVNVGMAFQRNGTTTIGDMQIGFRF